MKNAIIVVAACMVILGLMVAGCHHGEEKSATRHSEPTVDGQKWSSANAIPQPLQQYLAVAPVADRGTIPECLRLPASEYAFVDEALPPPPAESFQAAEVMTLGSEEVAPTPTVGIIKGDTRQLALLPVRRSGPELEPVMRSLSLQGEMAAKPVAEVLEDWGSPVKVELELLPAPEAEPRMKPAAEWEDIPWVENKFADASSAMTR